MLTSPQRHGIAMKAFEGSSVEEQCEQMRFESEDLYFLQQHEPAHTKAVAALKIAVEVYGNKSLHLVPFYLLLVDIVLCEKELKPAEEMLLLVDWLLVKTGDSPASALELPEESKSLLVVRMNKLYSLLHLEYGAFPEGLQCAAQGAHHCSRLFGPNHVYTSELYFCLGVIFYRMQCGSSLNEQMQSHQESQPQQRALEQRDQQKKSALAMLDKVVDIWYRFLTNPPEDPATWMSKNRRLLQEASAMLQQIVSIRRNLLGTKHVATGEVQYTLALLFLFKECHIQAKAFVKQAVNIYVDALGSEHPSTMNVIHVLQQLDEAGI